MSINDFGPNLSFKWSRSEYAVIGRVARKIWAKAMKTNMVLTKELKC
jgi:methylmalonyl-CoA mutase